MSDTLTPEVDPLREALPCEDPEEPCDADGRDEHRWCDNCIARSVVARAGLALATPQPALDVERLARAWWIATYEPGGPWEHASAENRAYVLEWAKDAAAIYEEDFR